MRVLIEAEVSPEVYYNLIDETLTARGTPVSIVPLSVNKWDIEELKRNVAKNVRDQVKDLIEREFGL